LKRKLLIVDKVSAKIDFIMDGLNAEYEAVGVDNGAEALGALSNDSFDMVITDLAVTDTNAGQLIAAIRERFPDMPVLALSAHGGVENASELIRLGVIDYIERPFTSRRLKYTVERAIEFAALKKENRALQMRFGSRKHSSGLVGNSVQLQHVREKIALVGTTNATILITGENGVGKELVASEIHRQSSRADAPFVKVNCACIPADLLADELFGREPGAMSSTNEVKRGKFDLADAGTILLDEIGEVEQSVQSTLLRIIQDGEFVRVGGDSPIKVDVRIIATTSRDLKEEIRKKRFREDLFYRLNVVPLDVPPLRERREDIPLLINHFIDLYARTNLTRPISLTEAAVEKLCNAYWKGNVRQLQNIIERAVILKGGAIVDAEHFQFETERQEQLSRVEEAFRFGSIRDMERLMILNRLVDNSNNRTRSAETLDISVRTLRNKLNEYSVPKKHETLVPINLSSKPR